MPKKGKAGLAVIVFIMILIIACILCFVVTQSKNKEDSEGNNGVTASEVENEKKFDVAVQYDEEDTNTTTHGDKLVFDNSSVTSDSDNVTIEGTTATITSGGTKGPGMLHRRLCFRCSCRDRAQTTSICSILSKLNPFYVQFFLL